MSGERDTLRESQITTDTETIRNWSETHGMVPVRYEAGGETHVEMVPESAVEEHHERRDWADFESDMREHEMVVVRHDDTDEMVVVDRHEAVGHGAITDREVEEALLEGETVQSEFTERAVVERTIVEEVTVESEVTDRELVESDTVDAQLITRDVENCEVTDVAMTDAGIEALDTFGSGTRSEAACDVEITLEESWTVTKENVERITIESHIVETNVEETDTLESDTIRETVDLEGVERTVLQGELVDSADAADRAIESGHVESQFRDDDAVETHLIRRQTVDEDVSLRRLVTGEVRDAETLASETIAHRATESDIVEPAKYDRELGAGAAATGAGVEDTESLEADEPVTTEEAVGAEASSTGTATPSQDDEGKMVVNASGDEIGMVAAVEDGRMHVDPHPSITDRIKTALGWSGRDEDTYPVDPDHIAQIEHDEVVLGVDRDG